MNKYIRILNEWYHIIINKKTTYKCIAYIDDANVSDKIVDAFELEEFSLRKAYDTAYDVINLKYPGLGINLRIFEKK